MLIKSQPEGAELSTLQGEVLGKTPLTLSKEDSAKLSSNGLINFKLSARGYIPRVVMVDGDATRSLQIVMPKSESKNFKEEFSRDFSKDMNRMLRSAFSIQKLISQKKYPDASTQIQRFKEEFGTVAFGYIVSAQMALIQGRKTEARLDLERAQIMDPDDPDTTQNLKLLQPESVGSVPPP